jgi:hypothetical protein
MAPAAWTSAALADESPAPTSKGATTVAPATATANPEDKVVCRYVEETGSRLGGHRICMKKSDWRAQAQDAKRQRDFAPPAGISGSH